MLEHWREEEKTQNSDILYKYYITGINIICKYKYKTNRYSKWIEKRQKSPSVSHKNIPPKIKLQKYIVPSMREF